MRIITLSSGEFIAVGPIKPTCPLCYAPLKISFYIQFLGILVFIFVLIAITVLLDHTFSFELDRHASGVPRRSWKNLAFVTPGFLCGMYLSAKFCQQFGEIYIRIASRRSNQK